MTQKRLKLYAPKPKPKPKKLKTLHLTVRLAVHEKHVIPLCREALNRGLAASGAKFMQNKVADLLQWPDKDRKEAIRYVVHQVIGEILKKYPEARIGF